MASTTTWTCSTNSASKSRTTWEELLAAAQTLKDNGYDAFANASGDPWTIAEIVFMNLAPTFIGGYEGRMAYLNGERCFNDENAVAAFQAVADLAPFVPEDQAALVYYDSQQIFLMGEAAMWLGGSWDIPVFEAEAPDFEWSVFAVPAPEGQEEEYVTFHLDAGMGMNAATEHPEEARLFLEWMTTPEFRRAARLTNCPASSRSDRSARAGKRARRCVPEAERRSRSGCAVGVGRAAGGYAGRLHADAG